MRKKIPSKHKYNYPKENNEESIEIDDNSLDEKDGKKRIKNIKRIKNKTLKEKN